MSSNSWVEKSKSFFGMSRKSAEESTISHNTSSTRRTSLSSISSNDMPTNGKSKKRGLKRPHLDYRDRGYRSRYSPSSKSAPVPPEITVPPNLEHVLKMKKDAISKRLRGNDLGDPQEPVPVGNLIDLEDTEKKDSVNLDAVRADGHKSPALESIDSIEIPNDICKSCDSIVAVGSTKNGVCDLCRAYRKIKKLEIKLAVKEDEHTKTMSSLNWHESEIEKLQWQLKDQEDLLQQSRYNHTRDYKMWKSDYNALRSNFDITKSNYQALEYKYYALEKKLQTSELEIGKLQKTELAKLHREEALLDATAKDHLTNNIRTKIQAISRMHFRKVSWKLSVETHPDLHKMVPGIFASRWTKSSWPMIRDNSDLTATAVIDAVLYSTITTRFFKDPFFRTENNPIVKEVLYTVYSRGREKNAKNMELWKKNTVELLKELSAEETGDSHGLDPVDRIENPFPQPAGVDKIISEIRTVVYNLLNLHNALTELDSPKLEMKIYDLITSSASLAEDWHSRDFRLCIIDVDWLESKGIDWCTDGASQYVTVFPKNKKLENVKYRIAAVITPGFIRYEKGDTEGSEIEIVWETASVLLEEADPEGVELDKSDLPGYDHMETGSG
ncbi:uncharacterized protein DFL_003703 [Arthrobotrys flagrans]|uniref:Uncharacterized protein n=1 Tax=Arthrobotrys flagrans TaxID=97331 RepID=A0A437A2L1_ARTFL|nr:hypothetical protein DFL_003703 [Arthrobotrys flagrans]